MDPSEEGLQTIKVVQIMDRVPSLQAMDNLQGSEMHLSMFILILERIHIRKDTQIYKLSVSIL